MSPIYVYRWLDYIKKISFFNRITVKISSAHKVLYFTLSTILILHQKYNLQKPANFNGYSFCIFATTSMCIDASTTNTILLF